MHILARAFLAMSLAAVFAALASSAAAQARETLIRVVDVGQGLCVVARAPEGQVLLYDAGFSGTFCADSVRELAGTSPIDVVVFSHSDLDHILDGADILGQQGARLILHPGDARHGVQLDALRVGINNLEHAGTQVIDMSRNPAPFGTTFPLGSVTLRFIAGWSDGAATKAPGDPVLPQADGYNALSLVIRLEYAGHAVLLTGDTIGRRRKEAGTACRNAERIMTAGAVPIASDVLVGQHHGGDNGTSNCFIRAVKPKWVVFSAGRGHGHPAQSVADRLIANGVNPDNMLRTDRADGTEAQWVYGTVAGCRDEPGDDDVEIRLFGDGSSPQVQYRKLEVQCPSRGPGGSLPPLRRPVP